MLLAEDNRIPKCTLKALYEFWVFERFPLFEGIVYNPTGIRVFPRISSFFNKIRSTYVIKFVISELQLNDCQATVTLMH